VIDEGWAAEPGDVKALRTLADVILPGDGGRWPAASAAINDIARVLWEIPPEDAAWALRLARALGRCLPPERLTAARAAEAAEPQRFAGAVQAVYRVYYTSAPVLTVVAEIADAGPREPSATFDTSLVARQLATQAGQRRL